MVNDVTPWVLGGVNAAAQLVFAVLWLSLALLAFLRVPRRLPGPRLMLTASGLTGATLSVLWPVVIMIATTLIVRQMGIDAFMQFQIGAVVLNTVLWLLPWALLLSGLLGLARGATRDDVP